MLGHVVSEVLWENAQLLEIVGKDRPDGPWSMGPLIQAVKPPS